MTDAEGHRGGAGNDRFADRRALNNGFGDAMARAVELVLTPMIMGFLGYLLDRWLGTEPVFMLALGLFTVGYVVWRMKGGYEAEMQRHEEQLRSPRKVTEAPR